MSKKAKLEEVTKIRSKRYSLPKESKLEIQNIQSVMGLLSILRESVSLKLTAELVKNRIALNIKDEDAPEGYTRSVDFDAEKYELLVTDVPTPPEPKEQDDKN